MVPDSFRSTRLIETESLSLCALTWIHRQQIKDVCQSGGSRCCVSADRSRHCSEHLHMDRSKKSNGIEMRKSRQSYLYHRT